MASLISTQAMSGLPILFPLYFAAGWFVLYAGCGGFPYLLAGAPKRNVVIAFWGFGIGGAAAGELAAVLMTSDAPARAFAVPPTIPWVLGFFVTRWLGAAWR